MRNKLRQQSGFSLLELCAALALVSVTCFIAVEVQASAIRMATLSQARETAERAANAVIQRIKKDITHRYIPQGMNTAQPLAINGGAPCQSLSITQRRTTNPLNPLRQVSYETVPVGSKNFIRIRSVSDATHDELFPYEANNTAGSICVEAYRYPNSPEIYEVLVHVSIVYKGAAGSQVHSKTASLLLPELNDSVELLR